MWWRRSAGLVIAEALVAAGAPGVFSQPYYAVGIRGNASAGELGVYRLGADGGISPYWSRAITSGWPRIHVDPFGRDVVFGQEQADFDETLEVWRVEPDFTLTQADAFHRDGWLYSGLFCTLSQDGAWYVGSTANIASSPTRFFTRAFRITDDLRIELGGEPLERPFNSELINIIDYVVASRAEGGVILATNPITPNVYVFELSGAGDITWDGSAVSALVMHPALRTDGRLAVGGRGDILGDESLARSFSISATGEVSLIDELIVPNYQLVEGHFVSNGLSIIAGWFFTRLDIAHDGTFPGTLTVIDPPSLDAQRVAVTPDGRFALFNHRFRASTSRLTTFRTPPGGGLEFASEIVIPGSWEDIEFIPPRTEDLLGDANADGLRDAADIVAYIRHFNDPPDIGGPTDPTITGPVPLARADANQDGEVTAKDLEWLLDFLLVDTADL